MTSFVNADTTGPGLLLGLAPGRSGACVVNVLCGPVAVAAVAHPLAAGVVLGLHTENPAISRPTTPGSPERSVVNINGLTECGRGVITGDLGEALRSAWRPVSAGVSDSSDYAVQNVYRLPSDGQTEGVRPRPGRRGGARRVLVTWLRGGLARRPNRRDGSGPGQPVQRVRRQAAFFLVALDRYRADRLASVAEVLDSAASARTGIAAVLRGTVNAMFADETRRGCLMVNSIAELAARDPAVAARARDTFERTAAAFQAALERGQRSREFSADLDARRTARYLASAINSIRLLAKFSDRAVADDVVEVTLKTLD